MIGVIIARFQTPYLHAGHINLVQHVKSKHRKVVIVLGVSPVLGSRRNPLDFHTREKMIRKEFPEVVILPLPDHPIDAKWSTNLDTLLNETFPGSQFTLYGSRNSFIDYYSGKFPVSEIPAHGDFNASVIRGEIKEHVMDSFEFRSGVIYAYANMYPKVYATVDIAVFRHGKMEILLGKKENDKKWRLPGGFSDPEDVSFEAAALRELREECGPIQVNNVNCEGSFRVEDWRYKKEVDKIITTLFSVDHVAGIPVASDDIAEVGWVSLSKLRELIANDATTPTHLPLFNHLLAKYQR